MQEFEPWIGREETTSDVVTGDLIRKLHATLSRNIGHVAECQILPLLGHFCLAQPLVSTEELSEDGHPQKGEFLPPIPLLRRMWAGGQIRFHEPLREGDTVERTSRILSITYKEGRSGPLCFVSVRHRLSVHGRLVLEEVQDIVFRGVSGDNRGADKEPEVAPPGEEQRLLDISSPLLFRYSALTFNSHRIHYDRNYAREQEGYPGLVFHGPLQATLLANFAAELKGRELRQFEFRSLTPLFDLHPIVLSATSGTDMMSLWTSHPGGPIAMTAKAFFG